MVYRPRLQTRPRTEETICTMIGVELTDTQSKAVARDTASSLCVCVLCRDRSGVGGVWAGIAYAGSGDVLRHGTTGHRKRKLVASVLE